MSDRFTMFRSTFEALRAFPSEDMKKAYVMIGEYALDGILPEPEESVAYGLFCSIKPLIDTSAKRSIAGRSGGEATQEHHGSKVQANLKQNRSNAEANPKQTEANVKQNASDTEQKMKEESIKKKYKDILFPYGDVIDYLNEKAGTHYKAGVKATQEKIKARCNEGFTLDDFKTVIDKKTAEWKSDPKMSKYLRPETLFGTKFESYLNQGETRGTAKPQNNRFCNFPQRQYDYDELEKKLLGIGG